MRNSPSDSRVRCRKTACGKARTFGDKDQRGSLKPAKATWHRLYNGTYPLASEQSHSHPSVMSDQAINPCWFLSRVRVKRRVKVFGTRSYLPSL